MTKVQFYDSVKDSLLMFAVIITRMEDKWVFCKHKDRETLEVPGDIEKQERALKRQQKEKRILTGYTLLQNIEKLHTTPMGVDRIKKNLQLEVEDVVTWCKEQTKRTEAMVTRQGKNWYVEIGNAIITINAYSYTIITAHKKNSR